MSYFSYVGKLFSNVKGFYNEINAATLTGAIDVLIVQEEDGSYKSSPFHVRFGKLGVLRAREKIVDIEINGEPVDLQMKLGDSGEAFFVTELEEPAEDIPAYLATSPIPSSADLMEKGLQEMKKQHFLEPTPSFLSSRQEQEISAFRQPRQHKISTDSRDKSDSSQEDVKEKSKIKQRRRKKQTRKKSLDLVAKGEPCGSDNHGDIFEIDDVSSDEELAMMPDMNNMGKSVSLPIMPEECRLQRTEKWASAQYDAFLHPFSDTDLSPIGSPVSTRPPSPKSDTELDVRKQNELDQPILSEEDNTLWEWGDLPRKSVTEDIMTEENDQQTASGGLFQFMRKTKNVRHKPEGEGIYLDDLNLEEMDPAVAKLYFPKRFSTPPFISIKDEDTESGRGASLPVSPHSVEGAIGGPPSSSSVSFLQSEVEHLGMVSLSLCGGLSEPEGVTLDKFMQSVVTFEDLCQNLKLINNPDYYNWTTAAPLVLSYAAFGKQPSEKEQKKGGVSSWFSWRRAPQHEMVKLDTSANTSTSVQSDTEINKMDDLSVTQSPPGSTPPSTTSSPKKIKSSSDTQIKIESETQTANIDKEKLVPCLEKVVESDRHSERNVTPVNISEQPSQTTSIEINEPQQFKKTIRLSSEQIAKLNLHEGQNEITYSVCTQYQGTTKCTSHIYLWRYDDKIVVSDIDGTITKSDVLGQILPIMGKDWSQSGVAELFSRIHSNGYKFLYLSARAIGQSKITKDLLKSIKQQYHVLPDGPLLLSPTSLVSAFHREVIEKKPEEFKISCLKDIGELFPPWAKPFYAGFGNKINDVYAYKAIDIPLYGNLTHVSDHFFPPLHRKPGLQASEYSYVSYWKQPLPQISQTELKEIEGSPNQQEKK
ncbi:hypothetical protein KUTeg_000775 [Tegillarca granosa]|uniref:phosphatidate phosphatase n=1 Tax=Tegillarca granosa TaxID=220873 RepID=A0ABQ9FYM6_TEGGR|nr:hypothetical protein KUTeg_000775 [Tegillarca granosa]